MEHDRSSIVVFARFALALMVGCGTSSAPTGSSSDAGSSDATQGDGGGAGADSGVCAPMAPIYGNSKLTCCGFNICNPDMVTVFVMCPSETTCHEANDGYYWSCYPTTGCTSWCSGSMAAPCPSQ
jgi:hypothetical protein